MVLEGMFVLLKEIILGIGFYIFVLVVCCLWVKCDLFFLVCVFVVVYV